MMKIGLFGGSFDPIHRAHIYLAEELLESGMLDKVIFIPTYIQPFKSAKCSSNAHHRLRMIELAIEDYENMEVSDFEIRKKGVSYTYATLKYFENLYKEDQLFFIAGADTFLRIKDWKYGTKLLENHRFIIANRPTVASDELERAVSKAREENSAKITIFENKEHDISSTEIRDRIAETMEIRSKLFEKVDNYIDENELYRDCQE